MKSFGIKRDEKDPRWDKFIEWGNDNDLGRRLFMKARGDLFLYYGFNKKGFVGEEHHKHFHRIIPLTELESVIKNSK